MVWNYCLDWTGGISNTQTRPSPQPSPVQSPTQMPPKTKSKKRKSSGGSKSSSKSNEPEIKLKKKKISAKAAKVLAEVQQKNDAVLKKFASTGMVTTTVPNNSALELRVADDVQLCDNMNITKKAGRGKIQHLFVLPGHLEILQFSKNISKSKRRSSQASQVSQISQPDLDVGEIGVNGVTTTTGGGGGGGSSKQASQATATDTVPSTETETEFVQKKFDPFTSPDCFGSVTDLGTGNPVVFMNVPEKKGRIKLIGTILNPKAPLMTLQLPTNKTKDGGSVSCDSTFSSIIVFDQISWVDDDVDEDALQSDEKKEEKEEISSSSSKKKHKKSKKLPKLDTAILGEIQTKFDLRSYIKKKDEDEDAVIVIE